MDSDDFRTKSMGMITDCRYMVILTAELGGLLLRLVCRGVMGVGRNRQEIRINNVDRSAYLPRQLSAKRLDSLACRRQKPPDSGADIICDLTGARF